MSSKNLWKEKKEVRVGELDLNKVIGILHDFLDTFGQYAYSVLSECDSPKQIRCNTCVR